MLSILVFFVLGLPGSLAAGKNPCAPKCQDRECGDDGCGGSCGDCVKAAPDCVDGTCRALCGTEFCCPDGRHLSFGAECAAPAPKTCEGPDKKDKYEKSGRTGSERRAYMFKRDAPQDPCRLSVELPDANLHKVGDEDWYCLQTKVGDCEFSPTFTFTSGFTNELVVRCWGKDEIVHYKTEKAAEAECEEIAPAGATKGTGLSCKVPSKLTLHDLKCGNRAGLEETFATGMRICVHVSGKTDGCSTGAYSISVK